MPFENLNEKDWINSRDESWYDEEYPIYERPPQKTISNGLLVESFFHPIEDELINKIRRFKRGLIIGCVAWLTNEKILEALSEVYSVQLIVQKEDFLRPDLNNEDKFKSRLKQQYLKLRSNITFHELKYRANKLFQNLEKRNMIGERIPPILCCGYHNKDRLPAIPRVHHKFLVFCEIDKDLDPLQPPESIMKYRPRAVWTGSFNFTKNSTFSLENAIYIESDHDNPVIESFVREHHYILGLSEELDWQSEWVAPKYTKYVPPPRKILDFGKEEKDELK